MQETRVWSPVQEDSIFQGEAKPVCHNYWASAQEPKNHNYWRPCASSLCSATREATAMRSQRPTMKSSPYSLQLEKAHVLRWTPAQPKISLSKRRVEEKKTEFVVLSLTTPRLMKVSATQSCPTLCDPMDCSLSGSSGPWNSPGKNTGVSISFSRGSSQAKDRTWVFCTVGNYTPRLIMHFFFSLPRPILLHQVFTAWKVEAGQLLVQKWVRHVPLGD